MDVDVAIVLDRSGSMAYAATERAEWPPNPAAAPPGWKFGDRVPPNSRWLDACAAVDVFLEELSKSPTEEMVSLTTYSSTAVTDCPFTHDYAAIQQAMNGYSAAFRSGATNIASGIDAGCNSFANGASRNWASKVIIALTDGIHNLPADPVASARSTADQKVMKFSVTFAREADQDLMERISRIGVGKHYHATTGHDLAAVFQDIARCLPILIPR